MKQQPTIYFFYLALHSPDQTKYLSNNLRAQISSLAYGLSKKMQRDRVTKAPSAYLKHDDSCECWAIAKVITSRKTKLEGKVIAIIGEEFKDITKRFTSIKPELTHASLPRIKQKIHNRINSARYLRHQNEAKNKKEEAA